MNPENIQHSTSNAQHPMPFEAGAHWMFEVGCWMLDVSLGSGLNAQNGLGILSPLRGERTRFRIFVEFHISAERGPN
jgi:hypothetical protein